MTKLFPFTLIALDIGAAAVYNGCLLDFSSNFNALRHYMKTYVVIPQYIVSEELVTLACNAIKSFKDTSDVTIVSVNDGGVPELAKIVQEKADVAIDNPENMGFAPTCNNGFQWVFDNEEEDCWIVCANNDIEVYEGWHKAMTEPFEMFENVAITGLISNKERVIDGVPIEKYSKDKITEGGLLDGWMQAGGLWLSKKSILQKIAEDGKVFDERFKGGGFEDVDLFIRMRDKHGMKIVMSGRSMFWHKEGATRWDSGMRAKYKALDDENGRKFEQKHGYNYWTAGVWKQKELLNG